VSERYEKESKALSALNVELLGLKGAITQSEGRVKHIEVDLINEKRMTENLIKSKKELMDTLNKYVVKCEMMEKDIFAMKEVNKHFEN